MSVSTKSTKAGRVEVVARVLCKSRGRDPDSLEPGDEPKVDGKMRNGDPAHFAWRDFAKTARAVISALDAHERRARAAGIPVQGGEDA